MEEYAQEVMEILQAARAFPWAGAQVLHLGQHLAIPEYSEAV